MIPQIIHYCWFGHGVKSPEIDLCIASWHKYCPDYEFRQWDETNSPMDISWIRQAYKHQKYAFVADYMRFYALYHQGGIYMDTDMLLIRSVDDFLKEGLFLGREDAFNASMGIIGAEKGNVFCKLCLDFYDSTSFNLVSPPIITRFLTPRLFDYGLKEEDITQRLTNGLIVYNSTYFYPIHYTQEFSIDNVLKYAQPNTYGIHLWNHSWTDEIQLLAKGEYKEGFHLVWKRFKRTPFLPLRYWAKVIKYVGNYIGIWER